MDFGGKKSSLELGTNVSVIAKLLLLKPTFFLNYQIQWNKGHSHYRHNEVIDYFC
jgi:hypothetical protein